MTNERHAADLQYSPRIFHPTESASPLIVSSSAEMKAFVDPKIYSSQETKCMETNIEEKQSDTHDKPGTSALVQLWEDAIAQYRRTTRLTVSEEKWLFENPGKADKHLQSLVDDWRTFLASKRKSKVDSAIRQTLRVLQENLTALDVMIGLPSQVVIIVVALNVILIYRPFHRASLCGGSCGYYFAVQKVVRRRIVWSRAASKRSISFLHASGQI